MSFFSKEWADPLTGDKLSLYEYVSWWIQLVILRRPWFLPAYTALTIYWWNHGGIPFVDDPDLSRWNLVASYLAIFVEAVVGLAMVNQTRRDAVLIRKINRILEHLEAQVSQTELEVETLLEHELFHENIEIDQALEDASNSSAD